VTAGEQCYCRIDVDFILNDPHWRFLSNECKILYVTIWATAVSIRRERLPRRYDARHFAEVARLSLDVARRSLSDLCSIKGGINGRSRLLKRDRSGCITVCGVRSKHKRLQWKDEEAIPPISNPYPDKQEQEQQQEQKEQQARGRAREEDAAESSFANGLLDYCLQVTAHTVSAGSAVVPRSAALVEAYGEGWCLDHAKAVVRKAKKAIGHPNYILAALESIAAGEAQAAERRTEADALLDEMLEGIHGRERSA